MAKHGQVVAVLMVNDWELNIIAQVGEAGETFTWAASEDNEHWKTDNLNHKDEPTAVQAALEFLFPELMAAVEAGPDQDDFMRLNLLLAGMAPGAFITTLEEAVELRDKLRASVAIQAIEDDNRRTAWNGVLRAVAYRYGEMSDQMLAANNLRSQALLAFALYEQVCAADLEVLESFVVAFGG